MNATLEIYKCTVLTAIAGLLIAILSRMPAQPLTMGQMRAAKTNHVAIREVMDRVPLVYVEDGSITVDNLENPMPVEVENTVEAEITR